MGMDRNDSSDSYWDEPSSDGRRRSYDDNDIEANEVWTPLNEEFAESVVAVGPKDLKSVERESKAIPGDADADHVFDPRAAAERLINFAATGKPLRWAVDRFLTANNEWQENREDPRLRSAQQVALKRFIKELRESVGPDQANIVKAIDATTTVIEDPELPSEWTDVLSNALMFICIATIAAAGAGAAGALLVNESFWKEAVKGAVAGFVSTAATLAAERELRKRRLPGDGNAV